MSARAKYDKLLDRLESLEKVAIAFSGGVDSTLLLKASYDALGDNVIAITANSAVFPEGENNEAKEFCKAYGIRQLTIDYDVMSVPNFCDNPSNRCYHCKKNLMSIMRNVALENGIQTVAEGSNIDDTKDYRPGFKAVEELGIISPLKEVGLTKKEIRNLSREMNLPTWDKPSYACLATRIPFGDNITIDKLRKIEEAEDFLHEMGFLQARARVHDNLCRIEIETEKFERIIDEDVRCKIVSRLKEIGFEFVSLDLQGYVMGSFKADMN